MSGRPPTRRELLTAGSALLASGVAGCVSEELGADDPLLGDPEAYLEVELAADSDGVRIDPPIAHLVNGGTLEWTAESGSHDTTTYHPETHRSQRRIPVDDEPWTHDVSSSNSFDRVFDGEGVYNYACTSHEAEGMVGTILVGLPDPDEQPALEPVPEAFPDAAREELERQNDRVREILTTAHE